MALTENLEVEHRILKDVTLVERPGTKILTEFGASNYSGGLSTVDAFLSYGRANNIPTGHLDPHKLVVMDAATAGVTGQSGGRFVRWQNYFVLVEVADFRARRI